jgi:hypothetical protein
MCWRPRHRVLPVSGRVQHKPYGALDSLHSSVIQHTGRVASLLPAVVKHLIAADVARRCSGIPLPGDADEPKGAAPAVLTALVCALRGPDSLAASVCPVARRALCVVPERVGRSRPAAHWWASCDGHRDAEHGGHNGDPMQ